MKFSLLISYIVSLIPLSFVLQKVSITPDLQRFNGRETQPAKLIAATKANKKKMMLIVEKTMWAFNGRMEGIEKVCVICEVLLQSKPYTTGLAQACDLEKH